MTSEATTRKTLIDEALRLAGWNLADPTQVIEEYEIDLRVHDVATCAPWGGR